jgi:hypothetical protein
MISPDPIINFLNLLVGVAAGWALARGNRALDRSEKWRPVGPLVGMVACFVALYVLLASLGLLHRMELLPGFVGIAIGVYAGRRSCCG